MCMDKADGGKRVDGLGLVVLLQLKSNVGTSSCGANTNGGGLLQPKVWIRRISHYSKCQNRT